MAMNLKNLHREFVKLGESKTDKSFTRSERKHKELTSSFAELSSCVIESYSFVCDLLQKRFTAAPKMEDVWPDRISSHRIYLHTKFKV